MAALRKSRAKHTHNAPANPEFLGEGEIMSENTEPEESMHESFTDEELEKQIVHDEGDDSIEGYVINDADKDIEDESQPPPAVKMPNTLSEVEFKWDIEELNET